MTLREAIKFSDERCPKGFSPPNKEVEALLVITSAYRATRNHNAKLMKKLSAMKKSMDVS